MLPHSKTWKIAAILAVAIALASLKDQVEGQTKSKSTKPPGNLRQLDAQVEKIQNEFAKGLGELAKTYADSGQSDRAKELLKTIIKINPDDERVRKALKDLDEEVFEKNGKTVDVEADKGWVPTNVTATKDKPIRFEASGNYRFNASGELSPKGFPNDDPSKDVSPDVRFGALMGAIKPKAADDGKTAKAPKPFYVGDETEYTPKEDGVLYLRLNVPPGKHSGKVRVKISGNISGS